jgi:DNA repair protein RadC
MVKSDPGLADRLLRLVEPESRAPVVRTATDSDGWIRPHLIGRVTEAFVVLALDRRHRPIACEILTTGSEAMCIVDPRQVLAWALRQGGTGAASIIVAHNHPSGDREPSAEDLAVTRRLVSACRAVGVRMLDHLIITDHGMTSLAERGEVPRA